MPRNIPKRSLTCSDALWNELRMAAAMRSVAESKPVSISELLRRGARREIAEAERGPDYEPPDYEVQP